MAPSDAAAGPDARWLDERAPGAVVVIPPPPTWVARVVELAAPGTLPRLLPDEGEEPEQAGVQARRVAERAEQVDGRWTLHPWWLLSDAGALLAWAAHLEGPVHVWRTSAERLVVHGDLAGYPTRLVGSSHRLPTDQRVSVTIELLEQIAAREDRWWSGVLDPVELDLPAAGDPLTVPMPIVPAAPAAVFLPVYEDRFNAPAWVYEPEYRVILPAPEATASDVSSPVAAERSTSAPQHLSKVSSSVGVGNGV